MDIAAEELSHMEMVAQTITLLTAMTLMPKIILWGASRDISPTA
jgi:Mn-containing catalase